MSKNYYIENQTTKKQGEHIMQKNVTAETPTDQKMAKIPRQKACHSKI